MFLKSEGSYEGAKDSERDVLACDENGFAQTKAMPYGIYTVHQTKGWEGRELMPDFDVYIAKDGEVYRNQSVCTFWIGGSIGVDIWVGEIIVELKKQKEYEDMRLRCAPLS